MDAPDRFVTRQIGDRPRNAQHAVVAARGELQAASCFGQQLTAGRVWRGDLRNRARDGSLYWVDTTIVPLIDDDRRPHQFIAIGYDITERKRSEAALRDQEALARLGKMAAVVAHEVRNPLAGIRGALQVIGRRLGPGTSERGVVNEAVARIDTLNGIVEDLLIFARPNKPSMAPVCVSTIIANTVTLFKQDPNTAGVMIHIERTDLIVEGDAEQLKIVLLNLVMNSAEAMSGSGAIAITTRRVGGCNEIRVADDGPGIAPEVQEHLFEPFFTTGHRGTGLGLVTARRIVEAHGGSLALECLHGGGTVAIVRLPAR
jgi:two-component system CheB/CheR fusion protein